MFEATEERLHGPALDMVWHLEPGERPIMPGDTVRIASIAVLDPEAAAAPFERFRAWCSERGVLLVNVRLAQDRLRECGFLEERGFRFIELNYRPSLTGLERFADGDPAISVRRADESDRAEIGDFAGRIFTAGRLHVDPLIGPEIGNPRYAAWGANAFDDPGQTVLKCVMGERTIAFMVVEQPTLESRFWSLVGVAPGLAGQGLGRRAWRAMLAHHYREGAREVATSITSHNVAVHNLYASLGFRFPAPTITLHWCPLGPIRFAAQ